MNICFFIVCTWDLIPALREITITENNNFKLIYRPLYMTIIAYFKMLLTKASVN